MSSVPPPLVGTDASNLQKSIKQPEILDKKKSTNRPKKRIGPFDLFRTLGQGSMGKVKLAIDNRTSTRRACKIMVAPACLEAYFPKDMLYRIDVSNMQDVPNLETKFNIQLDQDSTHPLKKSKDEDKAIRMLREACIMLVLDHPHIVALHEIYVLGGFFYFIFDYVSGGQMLDYIISHGKLKEKNARKFFAQLTSAVHYCHAHCIVHRDLKIENILIDEYGDVRLVDFGLGNFYSKHGHLNTFCGSLYFAAPELLLSKPYNGPEVDMWSLGVILYVLVTGRVPFDDLNVAKLHQKIQQGQVEWPSFLSSDCRNLLQRLLCVDSSERATMQQVLNHPWMGKTADWMFGEPLLTFPSQTDGFIIDKMRGFQFKHQNLPSSNALLVEKALELTPEMCVYALLESKIKRSLSIDDDYVSFESEKSLENLDSQPDAFPIRNSTSLMNFELEIEPSDKPQGTLERKPSKIENLLTPGMKFLRLDKSPNVFDSLDFPRQRKKSAPNCSFTADKIASNSLTTNQIPLSSSGTNECSNSLPLDFHLAGKSSRKKAFQSTKKDHYLHSNDLGRADESIQTVTLKGLFSVTNTSTKKPNVIRQLLMQTLDSLGIAFTEFRGGFSCKCLPKISVFTANPSEDSHSISRFFKNTSRRFSLPTLDSTNPKSFILAHLSHLSPLSKATSSTSPPSSNSNHSSHHAHSMNPDSKSSSKQNQRLYFDINIVKIPLTGMYGIQFRRISGDSWEYKKICTLILNSCKL